MNARLDDIATWLAQPRGPDVSPEAKHAARRLLVDQVAVALGGYEHMGTHVTERIAPSAAPAQGATLWGSGRHTTADAAALVNRADADALELIAGPECVMAIIAAAELADRTVHDVLCAIVAATDVDDFFRRWLGEGLERHGLHPPAFVGAVGACAGAARLLNLPPRLTVGALACASALSPQSPFVAFTAGSAAKTLYGAWSQMIGVQAATWAASGMVGTPDVWEGPRGIGRAILDSPEGVRPPEFEPNDAIRRVTFKPYACSRSSHATLTALDLLRPVDLSAVQQIDVLTYRYAVDVSGRSAGATPIAAQASIPHAVALALLNGPPVDADSFSGERLCDPRVADLANRVHVNVDEALPAEGPRVRRARVKIRFEDGTSREAESTPRWGLDAPAADEELLARVRRLTSRALPLLLWAAPPAASIRSLFNEARSADRRRPAAGPAHG